jgi:adenylate cyclase
VADKITTVPFTPASGRIKPAGEQREVTIVFADIRSFTTLAECLSPEELVSVLNSYLAVVIKSFRQYQGTIHKLMGDSVMAIWNAPNYLVDHAILATRAAATAQQMISELRKKESTLPRMDIGIGINTGDAITGQFGNEYLHEYSVVGDTVNIAARLTAATPGGKLWVTSNTFERIEEQVTARLLNPLILRGKRQPVRAYEVTGIAASIIGTPADTPVSTLKPGNFSPCGRDGEKWRVLNRSKKKTIHR